MRTNPFVRIFIIFRHPALAAVSAAIYCLGEGARHILPLLAMSRSNAEHRNAFFSPLDKPEHKFYYKRGRFHAWNMPPAHLHINIFIPFIRSSKINKFTREFVGLN